MTIKFNTKRNEDKLKNIFGENVRDWYMSTYPTDTFAADLPKNITFYDYFDKLRNYKNVYPLMGVCADSVIRERIFEYLATLMNISYDEVYETWYKGA